VRALAHTLSAAVQELQAGINASSDELRVDEAQTKAFLQSEQTRLLVAHYERVLGSAR
jgi:hypothetical protein